MVYWIQFRRIDDAHEIRSRRNSGWPDRHAGTVDMVTDNHRHGLCGCMMLLATCTAWAFSLASIMLSLILHAFSILSLTSNARCP